MLTNPNWRIAVLLVTVYGVLGYGALLGLVSLTSVERTLEPGARYSFCGFYLDCHLGVSIEGARAETAARAGVAALDPGADVADWPPREAAETAINAASAVAIASVPGRAIVMDPLTCRRKGPARQTGLLATPASGRRVSRLTCQFQAG